MPGYLKVKNKINDFGHTVALIIVGSVAVVAICGWAWYNKSRDLLGISRGDDHE